MNRFTIDYYTKADGSAPVDDFIVSLTKPLQAKILRVFDLLEELGPLASYPYVKPVRAKIYEIRVRDSEKFVRILYFFVSGKKIILSNGFIKKTDNTPNEQIEMAIASREDYIRRYGK